MDKVTLLEDLCMPYFTFVPFDWQPMCCRSFVSPSIVRRSSSLLSAFTLMHFKASSDSTFLLFSFPRPLSILVHFGVLLSLCLFKHLLIWPSYSFVSSSNIHPTSLLMLLWLCLLKHLPIWLSSFFVSSSIVHPTSLLMLLSSCLSKHLPIWHSYSFVSPSIVHPSSLVSWFGLLFMVL